MNTEIQKIANDILLHTASGDKAGEIELLWEPVPGARVYIIQVSDCKKTANAWKHADIVTRSRYTISGLKSGKTYQFRIAPVTNTGQGRWCTPVSKTAS